MLRTTAGVSEGSQSQKEGGLSGKRVGGKAFILKGRREDNGAGMEDAMDRWLFDKW